MKFNQPLSTKIYSITFFLFILKIFSHTLFIYSFLFFSSFSRLITTYLTMYNFFFFISWIFILINNVDSYPRWRTSSTDNYPRFPIRHGFLYPTESVPTTTQLTDPFDWTTTTTTIDEFYED